MAVRKGRRIVIVLVTMAVSAMMSPINPGPKNQLKNVDDSVVFTCVTPLEKCSGIEWYKREEQKVPVLMYRHSQGKRNLDIFGYTNYSVDAATEGCSLTINNLRLNDSGGYLCSIIHEGSEHRKFGALVVIDSRERQCNSSFDQNKEVSENDTYSITCSIATRPDLVGFTRDSLLWFNKTVIMKSDITRDSDVLSSQYSSVAKAKDILEFTCKLLIQPDPDPTYDQTINKLEVCALPRQIVFYSVRKVWLSTNKTTFNMDDEIECMADGYPPPTIKWKNLNTSKEFKSPNLKFKLYNASIGHVFMCIASNTIKNILYEVTLTGIGIPAAGDASKLKSSTICVLVFAIVVVFISWVEVEFCPVNENIPICKTWEERCLCANCLICSERDKPVISPQKQPLQPPPSPENLPELFL